ncbi:MAG: translesion error-prone DNA polymerase V autoproteolytic subunit [Burkholderiales bacterium]
MQSNQQHGGKRAGAGRKPGSSKWKEPTTTIRLPVSVCASLQNKLKASERQAPVDGYLPALNPLVLRLPLYMSKVPAGFPATADDHIEQRLDLNKALVKNKDTTFMVKVKGDSMTGANIQDGDMLIVDRSLPAKSGRIVVAAILGEVTVKRLKIKKGESWLFPENPAYEPMRITAESDCTIWGVVTQAIHPL